MVEKKLIELHQTHPEPHTLLLVDGDEFPELEYKYQVRSFPRLIVFSKGSQRVQTNSAKLDALVELYKTKVY